MTERALRAALYGVGAFALGYLLPGTLQLPVLVYDHIGIRETWSAHLKWLDENIRAVRAIKVAEAGWSLAALED